MPMIGALLRSGRLSELQALGAVGTPVYSAADQLLAAIRRQLGPEVTELFAVPKQNDRGDAIDWYAPAAGDVVPWSAASPEERTEAKASLLAARERILERSRVLQVDGDRERQVFGKLLEQATQIPSDAYVYLVNGKPVLTFWGFSRRGAPAGLDVLGELETGWPAPVRAPDAQFPAERVPAPVAETLVRRPWYWWLLWLLALLLLLALLWFGLRACGVQVPLVLPFNVTIPGVGPPTATVPPSASTRVIEEVPRVVTDRVGTTRVERTGLVETVDRTVVSGTSSTVTTGDVARSVEGVPTGDQVLVPPDGAVIPPPPPAALTGEGADKDKAPGAEIKPQDPALKPPVGQDKGPGAELKPEDQALKPPEPPPIGKPGDQATDKPKGEKPGDKPADKPGDKPGDKPTDKQTGPKPPPPLPDAAAKTAGAKGASATPPAGPPLAIPPDALKSGSTAFMNGQWRSTSGLQDSDGNPVQVQYDFKQGEGTATLVRGAGAGEQRCTGKVKPVMRDGKLIIEETSGIVCPDGTQFRRSNVECSVGEQGQAKCRGVNEDGSGYNVSISGK